MKRSDFIKTSSIISAGAGLSGSIVFHDKFALTQNKLPRWKGFNLLDYFAPVGDGGRGVTTEEHFKWMADWGFDFVRFPMAYPRYLSYDRSKNIKPEDVYNIDDKAVDNIEKLVNTANKYGLHVSLNLHRAPGFCINAGFNEPYNLWEDEEAQEAFYYHWGMWAKRFASKTRDHISFDLVNEPCTREDMNDQYSARGPIPGELYRKVAKMAMDTIRKYNPKHWIIADGNNGGGNVIPEIFELDIGQSCRGYFPHYISHYRAPWVFENPDDAPKPVWPGRINGQEFNRKSLEAFYKPWIEAMNNGVGVHCGECGCWSETPHDVFLAWFEDVLDVLKENGIGYALWEFKGTFGIIDSQRKDVNYDDWHGHKLDKKLLNLLMKY